MSELIVIKIVQKDVDKALAKRTRWNRDKHLRGAIPEVYSPYQHCPIACALDRMGMEYYKVGAGSIWWTAEHFSGLPEKARLFIRRFDRSDLHRIEIGEFDFAVRGPEDSNG